MPLEIGTVIAELDSSWPLSGDYVRDGDDHLRLLKAILQSQFPGEAGDGFDIPITATEKEINYLGGLTGNVQDQIDAIKATVMAPSGTIMMFGSTPPVGWTVTNVNDHMLRVTSEPIGETGGVSNPIGFWTAHSHKTKGHEITHGEMPVHSHLTNVAHKANLGIPRGTQNVGSEKNAAYSINVRSTNVGGSLPHDHGNTEETYIAFLPKFVNVVLARRD